MIFVAPGGPGRRGAFFVVEGPAADELLSVEVVAQTLGVEPITVYRWCRQGRLPCLKPGKS